MVSHNITKDGFAESQKNLWENETNGMVR